jgi:hypothetical protein
MNRMGRAEHTFQFPAEQIEEAASNEAAYHEKRLAYWTEEYETAIKTVEETIGATVKRQPITGGESVEVVIDYGDPSAYRRMQQSFRKMAQHREDAERFRTDQRLYGTQNSRAYELSTDDVHHFRLGGEARED